MKPVGSGFDFSPIGLTKREHFAGLAMQGMLRNNEFLVANNQTAIQYGLEPQDTLAKSSVQAADALIKELGEP